LLTDNHTFTSNHTVKETKQIRISTNGKSSEAEAYKREFPLTE